MTPSNASRAPGARARGGARRAYRLGACVALALAACNGDAEEDATTSGGPSAAQAGGAPTFASDVARIVYDNCAPCHAPGEAAPFPLLSYDDVAKRAKQIGIVTSTRYMPPWLPDPEVSDFVGDRSLTDDEIETIAAWVAAGAPEGDPSAAPPPPERTEGWRLGEPDLVLAMTEAFVVPAEGRDLYHNFVIPSELHRTGGPPRYVRAVEWRPDNRAVVHHAALFVDRSGGARARDAGDPSVGFAGMTPAPAQVPDGQFVGWAPGKQPRVSEDGIAWRLDDRTDVVLQLHLRPTGKPEPVRVTLGIHYADAPPTKHAVGIRLMSQEIDLPAGARDVRVTDEYELPVALDVLGVYPHAHYLATDMRGWAALPDGSTRELFHIPAWDFNWQDEYFYREPISLPKGTVLRMEYAFDNSADNVFNPSDPPVRVEYGERSVDEMAEMLLQVLPSNEDLPVLWRDFAWKTHYDEVAYLESRAEREPDAPQWHAALGDLATKGGRRDEAIARFRRVVELRPKAANPLAKLGHAYLMAPTKEAAREALTPLRAALEREPRHLLARLDLARALRALERTNEARAELDAVLTLAPGWDEANVLYGDLELAAGDRAAAEARFRTALASNPDDVRALWRLGKVSYEAGRVDDALALYRRALAVLPDDAQTHHLLGLALVERGGPESRAEGLRHLALAKDLAPGTTLFAEVHARYAVDGPAADGGTDEP